MKKCKLSSRKAKDPNPECLQRFTEWFRKSRMSNRLLARYVDVDPSYITLILQGKRQITYSFWRRVVALSNGGLKYYDWDRQCSENSITPGNEEKSHASSSTNHNEDIDI